MGGMGHLPVESPFKEAQNPLHDAERPRSPVKSVPTSLIKSPTKTSFESPFVEETPAKQMSDLSVKDGRKSSEGSNGPLGPL